MTKQEKIIVSTYTGVLMCNFDDVHEYIQKKLGRPVFSHELADKDIQKEIEEKSKEEFLEICNREEPEDVVGIINNSVDNALTLLDSIYSSGRMMYYSDYCALHDAISQISVQPDHTADIGKKVEGDCISRQAAIDRINKQREHLQPDIYPQDKIGDATYRICAEFIARLPSAQPEQRWVPCSERMPKESGQYLITVKYEHVDGYEDIYAEHGDWDGEEWDMFCFGHCGKVEDIVAWQPLPEPYRGGDSNE